MDMSKHITTIKQLIINRLPKKWRKQQASAADDDFDEEDDAGEISLTDGQKDKTLGINKKIVNSVIIVIGLIFIVALVYNWMDGRGSGDKSGTSNVRNEQAADIKGKNNLQTDYKDVQAQMQRANQEKLGQNGARNQEAAVRNNQQIASQQQVPAIRQQQGYSVPYMLPSAMAQIDANARQNAPYNTQASAGQAGQASEAKSKQNIIDRFKSAIDFAIGGGGAQLQENTSDTSSHIVQGAGSGAAQTGYSAPSNQILQAGTIIPMLLYTGINTDNAGQVIAQVQSDVYDSATGINLLIPMGSRAIGSYTAGANSNSDRVAITFSTIVYPNGASYAIGNSMIAVDEQGYNGIRGSLNKHMDAALGRTFVNGILGAGFTALSTIGANKANIDTGGLQQLLQSSTNIQPTVTVEPGYEFNIFVTQPILFN